MIESTFNRTLCYVSVIIGIATQNWFAFALGALFLHLMTLEGLKGPKGDTGATGMMGVPGMQGPKGDRSMTFDEYHEERYSRTD